LRSRSAAARARIPKAKPFSILRDTTTSEAHLKVMNPDPTRNTFCTTRSRKGVRITNINAAIGHRIKAKWLSKNDELGLSTLGYGLRFPRPISVAAWFTDAKSMPRLNRWYCTHE
jgi:hypothetical protein